MKKGFRIIKFKKDKPIFQLKDISKSFDGRPILKKISIEMFPGEIVGLLLGLALRSIVGLVEGASEGALDGDKETIIDGIAEG